MATLHDRLPGNVPGRFYVDASCIDCDQCRAMSPGLFGRDAEHGSSLVVRQPVTEAEFEELAEAMARCATGSIGDDGA